MRFSTLFFIKIKNVAFSFGLLRALIFHKVLAGAEHKHLLSSKFATVVDIGANRGQFSIAARHWLPNSRIFAFEPLAKPASIFKNLFINDPRVSLHQAAIGPVEGDVKMHISARDDSSSLLPISKVQTDIFPGTHEVATAEVKIAPLNFFISADEIYGPALLKLDVQGYEFEALAGCESLFYKFHTIYCECSLITFYAGQRLAPDVISYLANNGFRLRSIANPTLNDRNEIIQADFLFEREMDGGI